MFEQVVGDGASVFISIIAVIIGFGVAMGYVDYLKTKSQEKKEH